MTAMAPSDVSYLLQHHQNQIEKLTEDMLKLAELLKALGDQLERVVSVQEKLVAIIEIGGKR